MAPGRADSIPRPGVSTTDLLLLCMSVIWGVNFSVVKFGTNQMAPIAFNAIRMTIGVAALVMLVFARGGFGLSRRDFRALFLLGLIGNGIYQIMFIEGIARTRAGTAALILASGPAFVALIGRVLGTERVSRRGWAGIALSLVGMAIVSMSARGASTGPATLTGNLLVLGGALLWALFSVLAKPYANRIGVAQFGATTMLGGLLPLMIAAGPALAALEWGNITTGAWAALLYSGFGALALAGLFWVRGVRELGPTRTAMYVNLQPVMALLVAWAWLSEVPTLAQWGGAGAIIGGVLLTRS